MTQNWCIDANLRLPHGGLQVCTEMVIKTPAQDLLAYCGYFWIEVRINDLRQDGLVFRNLEGIGDHIAFSVAQPRRRRSEEHTSELQSRLHLVCRLLLE